MAKASFNPGRNPKMVLVRKSADQTVNNSTTLVNCTDLSFSIGANEVWEFKATLLHNSGATPDLKVGWTVPASATMLWKEGPDTISQTGRAEGDTEMMNGLATDGLGWLSGVVVGGGTAGTVQLQFAQNTQDASDTKMLKDSSILATKIA